MRPAPSSRASASLSAVTRRSPARRAARSAASRRRFAAEMRTSTGCASTSASSFDLGVDIPWQFFVLLARRRRLDLVEIGTERKDVEQRVEQRVAHLLHQVGRARITHEGVPVWRRIAAPGKLAGI